MHRNFTDKFISSLKPAPSGKRVEHWDLKIPSFGVRVSDSGLKTYILYLRWPGKKSPTRRKIGRANKITLAQARETAREWLAQVELKVDPKRRAKEDALRAQREQRTTFAVVAEAWFRDIAHQRKAAEVRTDVLREFVRPWGSRPITDITTLDVVTVIRAKKAEGHPAQARNLLGHVKRLLDWAVEQHCYGLEKSPAESLRAIKLIGKKNRRRRVLTDDELRAVWQAAEATDYPYGPLVRMLILTGQRKSEVGEARWPEFDLTKRLWTIPAERMKMDEAHVVPITEDLAALLQGLPRFRAGDHLFSTNFGTSPANGFSKAKERLGKLTGPFEKKWVFHDLRRTMRTGLSALPIPDRVREIMIAHAPPDLIRTYDLHKYTEEKRAGFGLWCAHLRGILQPIGSNVIELSKR
jgi:integrase